MSQIRQLKIEFIQKKQCRKKTGYNIWQLKKYMYKNIKINDFDYNLPNHKVAKYPLANRDSSKLLHFDGNEISQHKFSNLSELLSSEAFLIFNDTKVIQARMRISKPNGTIIEIFCLEPIAPADYQLSLTTTSRCVWKVMVGNRKRWKEPVITNNILIAQKECNLSVRYCGELNNMAHEVEFSWDNNKITFADILQDFGELPIPPYLNRKTEEADIKTYQTTYAQTLGSVAAPTAGLHFTPQTIKELHNKNISTSAITLHVGAGTFQPVRHDTIEQHEMHAEIFTVTLKTLEEILSNIGKIVAVGTTSVRTLESLYYLGVHISQNEKKPNLIISQWEAYENDYSISTTDAIKIIIDYLKHNELNDICAKTSIMIVPNFQFRIVSQMITNFHQPKSTLLLLVSAFVGYDNCKKIYDYALNNDFRFLSYGDSSLLNKT